MSQVERLKDLCARLGTADCLGQKPARPGDDDVTEKRTVLFILVLALHRVASNMFPPSVTVMQAAA